MTFRLAPLLSLTVLTLGCPQPDPTFSVDAEQLRTDLRAIDSRLSALETSVQALQDNQTDLLASVAALQATVGTGVDGADPLVTSVAANTAALSPILDLAEGELAQVVDYVGALDDYLEVNGTADELTIEGANLRLISDTEAPNTGNLLVGGQDATQITGEHSVYIGAGHTSSADDSLVLGTDHNAGGEGVLIAGDGHDVTADFAVALGGLTNTITGIGGVSVGGTQHSVGGLRSVAIGGDTLIPAAGTSNSVMIGGLDNTLAVRNNCVVIGQTERMGCPDDNTVVLPAPPGPN